MGDQENSVRGDQRPQPGCDALKAADELLEQRRVAEALAMYDLAQAEGQTFARCAAGRWTCWMLLGEFDCAWRESDALQASGAADTNLFWDGLPFNGKTVLLRTLHGYGDAIQFIRYAPYIRQFAQKLIVQTHPELIDLISTVEGIDEVTTWPDENCTSPWQQQIEVMELPRAFRTVVQSIPAQVPYLSIDRRRVLESRQRLRLHEGPNIGVLWASSNYDVSRSVSFRNLSRLFLTNKCRFYSFQRGEERAQLARIYTENLVHDTALHSPGPMDTAADLLNMDLLLSADSFAAHLAGALDVPVWLMLPYKSDWRWMLHRSDSPWYPGMRLFRQPVAGDWDSVIDLVQKALHEGLCE
ncbi:MAG: hypothetical protein IVW54_05115 [Candidatus Binataceae bacterium]|nr:hypothetical protein [Candidatus Binataceae bacterium]